MGSVRVFFFFQAEDGIRVLYVTGVQTCALPISRMARGAFYPMAAYAPSLRASTAAPSNATFSATAEMWRSEERRVGKECRSRWTQYHYKKKHRINREREPTHPRDIMFADLRDTL